jgi:hypothetical protein
VRLSNLNASVQQVCSWRMGRGERFQTSLSAISVSRRPSGVCSDLGGSDPQPLAALSEFRQMVVNTCRDGLEGELADLPPKG